MALWRGRHISTSPWSDCVVCNDTQPVQADPTQDPVLMARKADLDRATEVAKQAFAAYRDRMQSEERGNIVDEVRLRVEKLADVVMTAEGVWAERVGELGMFARIRSRALVRTDLWGGLMFLQQSVWDAQLNKVATELELEEKRHRALAALHELMAVETQAKREGTELEATKESLKRARMVAQERLAAGKECKARLDDVTTRATPADGGMFVMPMQMQTVQNDFQLDPLEPGIKESLASSCRRVARF